MELLTEKQIRRRARDMRIAENYRLLRDSYPNSSEARIICEIVRSGQFGLSFSGVRDALIRQQCITPTPQTR